jgi:uncharacterized protein
MKKLILTILFAQLWIPDSGAQLLWKVSGQYLTQDSYLFGTIHLIPKSRFYINPQTEAAFKKCQTLVLEANIKPSLREMLELAGLMVMPDQQVLSQLLSESEFLRLKSYCLDSLRMNEKKFNSYQRIKPFFFSSLLLQQSIEEKTTGYESVLLKKAKRKKKKAFLEEIKEQLAFIDSIPLTVQAQMLMNSLGSEKAEYDSLVSLYLSEDLKGMETLSYEQDDQFPSFSRLLLVERNKQWIPRLQVIMSEGPAFVAVGAAHLPGDLGLIQLLRNEGYTVEPVYTP